MIRLTSYSSEDSLILRSSRHCKKKISKRCWKYVTTNEYENILDLQNVTFTPQIVKILHTKFRRNLCKQRSLSIAPNIGNSFKSDNLAVNIQIRTEYYNDMDLCPKQSFGKLDMNKIRYIDESPYAYKNQPNTIFPEWKKENKNPELLTKYVDILSSNESTLFLDAIDVDCNIREHQDSDEDTMKSITKTNSRQMSVESIALQSDELSQDDNIAVLETNPLRFAWHGYMDGPLHSLLNLFGQYIFFSYIFFISYILFCKAWFKLRCILVTH